MTDKFEEAKRHILEQIAKSKRPVDPTHAVNTMEWVKKLRPDADEILLLAGLAHDIERSMPDPYTANMFASYDEYKLAHAARAGDIAAKVILECDYSTDDAHRIANMITHGEFASDDPDTQLLCDADSISFFDNNIKYYFKDNDIESTQKKVAFMYERASKRAQQYIREVMEKSELGLSLPELDN